MEAYAQSTGQHIPLYVAPSYFTDNSIPITPEVIALGLFILILLLIIATIFHAIHFIYIAAIRGVRLGIEFYVAAWLLSFTKFGRRLFGRH